VIFKKSPQNFRARVAWWIQELCAPHAITVA
jgi:hypothetical protein